MVLECLDKVKGFFFVYICGFSLIKPVDDTSCILREQCNYLIHFQDNTTFSILILCLYSYNKVPILFL